MSTLSSLTKSVYVAVLYDEDNKYIQEGPDYAYEDDASCNATDMVSKWVEKHNKWCFARVERRIVPIYQ